MRFRIFLNYRREDAAGHVGRLCDSLREGIDDELGFGDDQIFIDIDTIEPGVDFREAIRKAVEASDVFLTVIGRHWLTAVDPKGHRRLDSPADFVRIEIEAALERAAQHHDLRVVPTLVQGAGMPGVEDLPGALADLARRNAIELTDERWHYDVGRLFALLKKLEREKMERTGADFEAAEVAEREREVGVRAKREQAELEAAERAAERAERALTRREVSPRLEKEREQQEPGRALEPAMLRRTLREAALRGVVPATETRAVRAPPSALPAPIPDELRRAPPPPQPRRMSRPRPLLRLAVPLALLGGTVVAAKWLLGWFVDAVEAAADIVECTVFSPPVAAPGTSVLVQAFVHLPEDAADARALALEFDTAARARTFRTLTSQVSVGAGLDFELQMPGLEIDDPVASLVWRRRAEAVQFGVHVPPDAAAGTIIGTLAVSLDSAPLGHVKFKLTVEKEARPALSEPQGEEAARHKVAFISYSSRDRDEVLRRVQLLSLVGIKYFQDVLTLEPGDRFSRRIELGIDECDLFLLFWSSDAKRSEWVRREVRHALARKAGDDLSPPEIRPVIVEGPPVVEPWEELAHLHFNDRLLYFMRSR